MNKLRRCPFCGDKEAFYRDLFVCEPDPQKRRSVAVECKGCGCLGPAATGCDDEWEKLTDVATKMWNERDY